MDAIKVNGEGMPVKNPSLKVGDIDTAAPFDSVLEAVSRFGCIVNKKAHKAQTAEDLQNRVYVEQHEKPRDEMQLMKKKSEEAELLKELDSTYRLIAELKMNLERALSKEHEAKEHEAQQEVAVAELASVRNELENLHKDYNVLVSEKDIAVERAREAASSLKDVERQMENLNIQLMMTKESLESTQAAHIEAEQRRMGRVMAHEQDSLIWKQELEQAQEELEKTNQQINSIEYQKSKLDNAAALLHALKTELAAYKESKMSTDNPQNDMHAAVKQNIIKTTKHIDYLKTAVSSLKTEVEREKTALVAIKQREGMAEVVVASLEAELNQTVSEIALVQSREKKYREKMLELPRRLQRAAREADEAKSRAQEAREKLTKAKERVEQAKDGASRMERRLVDAQKEIEAARGLEKLALAVIDALNNGTEDEAKTSVTLSLEEYYELSNKAQEAEEGAHTQVAEAMSLIDVAKESESKSLCKLEQVSLELAARKEAFDAALEKAEKAERGKLGAEQDLRKWRAEHQQRRKAGLEVGPRQGFEEVTSFSARHINPLNQNSRPVLKTVLPESNSNRAEPSPEVRRLKKKGSFFPRIYMDLRKIQS